MSASLRVMSVITPSLSKARATPTLAETATRGRDHYRSLIGRGA